MASPTIDEIVLTTLINRAPYRLETSRAWAAIAGSRAAGIYQMAAQVPVMWDFAGYDERASRYRFVYRGRLTENLMQARMVDDMRRNLFDDGDL